jgi:hypothetical protein
VKYNLNIPVGVDLRVRAECLDYKRREDAIKRGEYTEAIRAEFKRINSAIDAALTESCDPGIVAEIRNDLGNNCGWYKSALSYLGHDTYYNIKQNAKVAIAIKLHIYEGR